MKKGLLYGLILTFFSIAVKAQTPHVDSIKVALELHPSQDTARINLLILMCKGHVFETNDMDQLAHYNEELYPLSQKLGSRRGLGYGTLYKGILSKIKTDYPQAMLHLEHALAIFKSINERSGIAGTYINMGLVEDRLGNYKKAIQYATEAAQIRKELGDVRGTASALNNLGISYGNLGDYKKSLSSYFKSLELRESINDKLGMSVSYLRCH